MARETLGPPPMFDEYWTSNWAEWFRLMARDRFSRLRLVPLSSNFSLPPADPCWDGSCAPTIPPIQAYLTYTFNYADYNVPETADPVGLVWSADSSNLFFGFIPKVWRHSSTQFKIQVMVYNDLAPRVAVGVIFAEIPESDNYFLI